MVIPVTNEGQRKCKINSQTIYHRAPTTIHDFFPFWQINTHLAPDLKIELGVGLHILPKSGIWLQNQFQFNAGALYHYSEVLHVCNLQLLFQNCQTGQFLSSTENEQFIL
jgi:hypothetical protein